MSQPNLATAPDLRVLRTRDAFRKALLSLLEAKRFEAITIRELTARAGTGYATFFRHYSDLRALLNDVVTDEVRDLIALAFPVLRSSNARATATTLCRYVDEHRQLWAALLTGESAGTLREEFIRQARNLPRVRTKTSSWLPTELKIVYSVSALFEVLSWWLQQQGDFSVDRVAAILDRLIIAPMTA